MAIRIDAAARGQVRAFRQQILYQARRIQALSGMPDLIDDLQIWHHKTNARGRDRVVKRIQRALPGVRWFSPPSYVRERVGQVMIGAYLDNSGPTIIEPRDPGQTQESVVVRYILLAKNRIYGGLWTLEIPIHALGRIAQRLPNANLADVIYAGHRRALASVIGDARPGTGFWLATPPAGAFFCELIVGPDESCNEELTTFIRARTWVHNDQLRDDQHPIPEAVNGQPRLGDGLLLPMPIRKICFDGRYLSCRLRIPS